MKRINKMRGRIREHGKKRKISEWTNDLWGELDFCEPKLVSSLDGGEEAAHSTV